MGRTVNPQQKFYDNAGTTALASGFVQFNVNESSTAATIFSDPDFQTTRLSLVELDAGGRLPADVFFRGPLRIVILDADSNELRFIDDITELAGSSSSTVGEITYDSVASLKADPTLISGDVVKTVSYYGNWSNVVQPPLGGARYEIVPPTTLTIDGTVNFVLNNGFEAQFIPNDSGFINVYQAGALGDETGDDIGFITNALSIIGKVEIDASASCLIGSQIIMSDNQELMIDGEIVRNFTNTEGSYKENATIVNISAPATATLLSTGEAAYPSTPDTGIKISGNGTIRPTVAISGMISGSNNSAGPAIALLGAENSSVSGGLNIDGNINSVGAAFWIKESVIEGLNTNLSGENENGVQILGGNAIQLRLGVVNSGLDAIFLGSNADLKLFDVNVDGWTGNARQYAITLLQDAIGNSNISVTTNDVFNISISNFAGTAAIGDKGAINIKADTENAGRETSIHSITMNNMSLQMGALANRDVGATLPSFATIDGGLDISIDGSCPSALDTPIYTCSNSENLSLDFNMGEFQQSTGTKLADFVDNINLHMTGNYDLTKAPSIAGSGFIFDGGSYVVNGRYYNIDGLQHPFEAIALNNTVELKVDAAVKIASGGTKPTVLVRTNDFDNNTPNTVIVGGENSQFDVVDILVPVNGTSATNLITVLPSPTPFVTTRAAASSVSMDGEDIVILTLTANTSVNTIVPPVGLQPKFLTVKKTGMHVLTLVLGANTVANGIMDGLAQSLGGTAATLVAANNNDTAQLYWTGFNWAVVSSTGPYGGVV